MKKLILIFSASAFLVNISFAQIRAYEAFLPNISNPAYFPYGDENTAIVSNEFFAVKYYPFIYSAFSLATNIKGISLGFNNLMNFNNYYNNYSQSISLAKSTENKLGKFTLGMSGIISNGKIQDNWPAEYSTRLGLSMNIGLAYQKGNHFVGLSANKLIGRSTILFKNESIKMAQLINFRYHTSFDVKGIRIQPFVINDGFINTPIKDWSLNYFRTGLSFKYQNIKIGYMFSKDRRYKAHGINLGYDFEKFSIQYSNNSFYYSSEISRLEVNSSHNLTFKFSPSGWCDCSQMF